MEPDDIHEPADASRWDGRKGEFDMGAVGEEFMVDACNGLACGQYALDSPHLCAS